MKKAEWNNKKSLWPLFYEKGWTTSGLEPLWRGSFLYSTKFPENPGARFIDLGRKKGWVDLQGWGVRGSYKKTLQTGFYIQWWSSVYITYIMCPSYNDRKKCTQVAILLLQDLSTKTNSLTIPCGVPEESILGPLLFIVYINNLYRASKVFKPIMFADDTNLFCSGKHIKTLFQTANI